MDWNSIRRNANKASKHAVRQADFLLRTSPVFRRGTEYTTGRGRVNRVTNLTENYLFVAIPSTHNVFHVEKEKVKQMIKYFLHVRIVERKELEAFSKFSSSMFGLLLALFRGKVSLRHAGNLLRLVMLGTRIYLAGGDRCPGDLRVAHRAGAEHVLHSFAGIRDRNRWRYWLKTLELFCILDSGAFSANNSGDPVDIDEYISFIHEFEEYFDHYFQLDVMGDPEQTMHNLRYMENAGLTPVPVFHMGSPWRHLDELISGRYPVIGLGGTVNQRGIKDFFQEVFSRYPKALFHGLGVTKADLLTMFPFFSCDSRTWVYGRRDGRILTPGGETTTHGISPGVECMTRSIQFLSSLEFACT